MRVIDAPGVEMKEIDKSGYTPAMTGSKCYVMGYSDKGTPYEPMQFTSKAAWQLYYGDPDNEAERYFYNACAEVINQNGVLNCARLPYDNKAFNKMVGYKFKVGTTKKNIPNAGEYVQIPKVRRTLSHDKDFEVDALNYTFDNLLNREINGKLDSLELDTELRTYYKNVINAFDAKYAGKKDRYSVEYYEALTGTKYVSALSARFLTKKEANEYVESFKDAGKPGVYKYYTDINKCVKYDNGDWLALPICCEFKKEVSCDYKTEQFETIKELSVKTQGLIDIYPDNRYVEMNTLEGIGYNVDILETKIDKLKTEERKTLSDLSADLIAYQSSDETTKEMRKYTAYNWMELCCNGDVTIEPMNVYGSFTEIDVSSLTITVPRVPFKEVVNDGYDNEPMFYQTVQWLYDDLSVQFKDNNEVNNLMSLELWRPALSCSLRRLIRDNNMSFQEFKDAWTNDHVTQQSGADTYLSSWDDMLGYFANNSNIKFKDIIEKYGPTKYAVHTEVPLYPITDADPSCGDYLEITQSENPITCSLENIDAYRTGEEKVAANTFWVFDKTCATLNSIVEDKRKGKSRQMIGIFPVVTTAANAMYAQSLIDVDYEFVTDFETVNKTITKTFSDEDSTTNSLSSTDIVTQMANDVRTTEQIGMKEVLDTISRDANGYFLPIQMNSQQTGFDTENLKKIGVVVYKAYLDASEGNKVSFTPVESFVGSLDKDAKNPNTGVSLFIDKIVNTQSDYIYFFSNCFVNAAQKKTLDEIDLFIKKIGPTGMLGWFSDETKEEISLTSLYQGIDKCFQKIEDINERDIDIVCDAGLANIAQYMKSIYSGSGAHAYDLAVTDEAGNPLIKNWTCNKASDVEAWKTVQFKYDNFCKNVRKDCMFIADGPRPLVLQGEKKIVRSSKPTNTIDANILPNVKYITGLNTNYGAGYCDWFQITDEFTGDEFWCPPSIKAMGVYVNTDVNFNYWDAPAGLNRGVVQALDVSFSPTIKQAGSIYTKNWNYAINYPYDGIVLEGQKTFQVKPSAFDRVSVRRLFLRLERQIYHICKYFEYEGNTSYTRQRLVDLITPVLQQVKVGGGLYDFKVKCDEGNNTPTTIDRNELHIAIGLKPTKVAEFIFVDMICLPTGGSWSESGF